MAFEAAGLRRFLAGVVATFAGLNAGEQNVSGLLAFRRVRMALETFQELMVLVVENCVREPAQRDIGLCDCRKLRPR